MSGSKNFRYNRDSASSEDPLATKTKAQGPGAVIENLEHRILFSADVLGLPVIDPTSESDQSPTADSSLPTQAIQPATDSSPTPSVIGHSAEIVFIDYATPDIARILADLSAQQNEGRSLQVVMIDSENDGIEVITDTLASTSNVSALHIISHGNDTGLSLGSSWLDLNTADRNAESITQWQNSLTANADLLLYGCNLAASAQGIDLLNALGTYSNADVAASNNSTGHAFFQGDWNLEYSQGIIETEIALSQTLQNSWSNELALDLLAVDDDFGELLSNTAFVLNDAANAPDTNILGNDQTSASSIQLLSVSDPSAGTLSDNNGVKTYTPDTGYTGSESFDYIITDSTQPIAHHFPLNSSNTTDSTTGNETVAVAPQNQPTIIGSELEFDGNDYIEISDIDYPSQFTLSLDFKVGDINTSTFETLFQHGIQADNSIGAYISGNFLHVNVTDSNGDAVDIALPSFDISAFSNTGTWQTLTITHSEHPASGPTGQTQIEIYISGVNQNVYESFFLPQRGGDPIDPAGSIYLGKYIYPGGTSADYLENHQIREFKIYDELITPNAANQPIDYSTGTVSLILRGPNQAPVFSALDGNPLYVEDQPSVIIDNDATLIDAELTAANNFNGSKLSLQRSGGENAADIFSSSGNLSQLVEGQPLIYTDQIAGSTVIGTVSVNSGGQLALNFGNNSSNDLVNRAMQAISYSNSSNSPPASVDIEWTFNDGFSGPAEFGSSLSATASTTIDIEETPDFNIDAPTIPVITDEDTAYVFTNEFTVTHDQSTAAVFSVLLTVDHGKLNISATPTITVSGNNSSSLSLSGAMIDLNQTLQSVIYQPDADYNGTDQLLIRGNFDSKPAVMTTVSADILVNSINDLPVIGNANDLVTYNAETAIAVPIDSNISISDSELSASGNYENTSITLVRINSTGSANGAPDSANAEDNFTAPAQASNLLEGSDLIDGNIFGHVQKNSNGELHLIFNVNADQSTIDTLLQSIHYNSNSAWPPAGGDWPSNNVELLWSFNDNGNDELGITGSMTDEIGTTPSVIDIITPGSPPQEITNEFFIINTGASPQIIDPGLLEYIDPDSTPSEVIYTITSIDTSAGILTRNGTQILPGETFTQQDIDYGLLTYTPTTAGPATIDISFDVRGSNFNSDSGTFTIITIDDGPTTLQSGIRLNLDGGNDAFLGGTGDAEFLYTTEGWTREFTISELSFNTGNTEATLYSASGGTKFVGHYEYLSVKPDGTIEWYERTLQTGSNPGSSLPASPMLSAIVPGILDGGLHTLAITLDSRYGGDIQLFYDGTLLATASNNIPQSYTWVGGYPWVIGQQLLPTSTLSTPQSFDNYNFVPGAHFSGVMHEARHWNEIRTLTEIQNNSNARLEYNPASTPALSANWHMHDPNGDETIDQVLNLAPGTTGQPTPSTLVVGHATGAGFTPSTPIDELVIDDTTSDETVVGYITPTDPVPDLAGYEYSILPNSQTSAFSINATTGEVVVSDSSMLSETASDYDLVIRVKSTDASGVTHNEDISLRINAINEPPTLTLTGTVPVSYTEGDDPIIIDSGITITDDELEATSFGGSTLTLQRFDTTADTANANPNDLFSSDLFNTTSAIFTSIQNNGILTVYFNPGSTASAVHTVLQSIKYQNTSDDPLNNIVLQWTFNDGNVSSQGSGGALESRGITDIQITPVNDAPVLSDFTSPFATTPEDTTIAISFNDLLVAASDVDGTVTNFKVVNLNSGSIAIGNTLTSADSNATMIGTTDSIYWTPPSDTNGLHTAFQLQANDDLGAVSGNIGNINIQVDSVSDHPEGSDHTIAIIEDSSRVLTIGDFGFSDKDSDAFSSVNISTVTGGALRVSNVQLSVPAVVAYTDILGGALSFKPHQDQHSHTAEITFEVIDTGTNNTDLSSNVLAFNVASVNDAPTAQNKTLPILEDTPLNLEALDFGFTDIKDIHSTKSVGDNPYRIKFDTLPAHGVLKFKDIPLVAGDDILFDNFNGTLIYEPELNNHTDTWINFRVTDNGGTSDGGIDTSITTYRIDVPISSVNDSPSGQDQIISVLEGATHTFSAADFGFTDVADKNNLESILLHTLPLDGALTLSGAEITTLITVPKADIDSGLFIYVPPTDTQGTVDTTFSYYVKDDGGTANSGMDTDQNFNVATISNQGINDSPVVYNNNAVSVIEDTPYSFIVSDFGYTDQESHNLKSVEIVTLPTQGTLSLNNVQVTTTTAVTEAEISGQKLVYTPNLNRTGTPADSFHFRVQDDGGVMNGGADFSLSSQPLLINIDNNSDEPLATNFTINVIEENYHLFTLPEFGFQDIAENDDLKAIHVKTLPVEGTLTLSDSELTGPTVIDKADIENGLFKYLPPDTEYDADTSFDFRVQDTGNTGLNISQLRYTATINNIDVNDPPIDTGGGAATIGEDTSYIFQTNDFAYSDLEDHLLINIIIDSLPSFGLLSVDGVNISSNTIVSIAAIDSALFAYTPTENSIESDQFFYRIQDDGGTLHGGINTGLTSQPFTLNITPVNDHPSASDFGVNVNEDALHTFYTSQFGFTDVADTDTFKTLLIQTLPVDGQLLLNNIPLSSPALINVQDIDNGLFQYRPPEHTQGNIATTFAFSVQDTGGTSNGGLDTDPNIYTATIINNGVNDPPIAHSNNTTIAIEDTQHSLTLLDFDFDDHENHQLKFIIIDSLPFNGSLSHNAVPVVAGTNISAADISAGLLKYQATADTNGLALDTFYYRVQDTGGTLNGGNDTALTSQPLTINVIPVNDHPTASDFTVSVTEDFPHMFQATQFGFTDPADQHTFESLVIKSLPATGQLILNNNLLSAPISISIQDIDNGLLQYIPPEHTQGSVDSNFTFTVQDGGGDTNGGIDTDPGLYTATITNIGVNDPPAAHTNNSAYALEDTLYVFELANFAFDDPENDQLEQVIIDSLPTSGSLTLDGLPLAAGSVISATDISTGLLNYQPATDANGLAADTFYYRVQDNGGTLNGGNDTAVNSQLMTIYLSNVNDPPVGSDNTISVLEDTPYQFTPFDFPYSDPESDSLKEIIIQSDTTGHLEVDGTLLSIGSAVSIEDLNDGNFHYTPPADLNGAVADAFSFLLRDTGDTLNNGKDTSVVSYTMTIDIASINDPPKGSDAVLTTFEDTPATLGREHFIFTDTENDDIEAIIITSLPQNGQLALSGTPLTVNSTVTMGDIDAGNFDFTPVANAHGINYASFNFQLIDDATNSGANTDGSSNAISINVVSVSDAPVAQNSQIQIREDHDHIFTLNDFLVIDQDDAPFENSLHSIEVIAVPTQGYLTLDDDPVAAADIISAENIDAGQLQYAPTADAHGDNYATLEYIAVDNGSVEHGGINISNNSAVSTVSVTAENDAPLAIADELTTTESQSFDSTKSGFSLTDNDTDADTDGTLSVSLLTPPSHGNLLLNTDGTFVYQHDGSETSSDEFTYLLSDGTTTDEASVRITILPLNDAPVSQSLDALSLNENAPFNLQLPDLLFSDPDPNDALQITLDTNDGSELPTWISFDPVTMQISGTPVVAGSFVFTLTATDSANATTTTELVLKVTADPEIAAAQPASSVESIQFSENAPTTIGRTSSVAIVEPASLAKANQISVRSAAENLPEDIHKQIDTPESFPAKEIQVFSANKVHSHSQWKNSTQPIEVIKLNPVETLAPLSELFDINETQFASSIGYLARQLDNSSGSMSDGTEINLKVASATIGVSTGFSIGYIVWLLRGGLLLSSVMSSLPAWRSLDPLPVLATLSENNDNSDDESLEELVNADDDTEQQIEDQKVDGPVDVNRRGNFNDM